MHIVSFTLPTVPDRIGVHFPCRSSIQTTELQGFRNSTGGRFTIRHPLRFILRVNGERVPERGLTNNQGHA
eukprot:1129412-Prorocentrum_minimum.AAC.1